MSDSITVWFEQLRQGDAAAAEKLWERFFDRLVTYARGQMENANRRISDEEDIAAGVMAALCACADRGKLPAIGNRDDLWRLLLCWARHDITDHVRAGGRIKRGRGLVRGDSVFDLSGEGFDQIGGESMPADVIVEMDEQLRTLLAQLPSETLRSIAKQRMHGYSNDEIATHLQVSPRTIERKLRFIRSVWSANASSI